MKQFKLIFGIIGILSLSGCGSSDNENMYESQYSTNSVMVGASGLLLEPSQNMYVTFPRIENFYLETQNCVGVIATGPTVAFKSFSQLGNGGYRGVYSFTTQLVLINTDEFFPRSSKTDEQALRHEFLHHLLVSTGLSWEDNKNHIYPPQFGICG